MTVEVDVLGCVTKVLCCCPYQNLMINQITKQSFQHSVIITRHNTNGTVFFHGR